MQGYPIVSTQGPAAATSAQDGKWRQAPVLNLTQADVKLIRITCKTFLWWFWIQAAVAVFGFLVAITVGLGAIAAFWGGV